MSFACIVSHSPLSRKCLVAVLLLFNFFIERSLAANFFSKGTRSGVPPHIEADAVIPALVISPVGVRHEFYSQALDILSSLQSSPSCHRLATSTLLKTCQTVEGPSTEAMMEHTRSLYAAQLAICELKGAGSPIPQYCSLKSPLESGMKMSSRQLEHCLQSLESRAQWWVSYSNSRQNAVVLCQAARADIEKDELIKIHKKLVTTTSSAEAALVQTLEEAGHVLTQQREFSNSVELFQKALLIDLHESRKETQSSVARLMKRIESNVQALFDRISLSAKAVEDDVNGLSEVLQKSRSESSELNANIGKVFQQVIQGASELSAQQTDDWGKSRALAMNVQESLKSVIGHEAAELLSAFGAVHHQIQASNELMLVISMQQTEIGRRMEFLNTTFEELQVKLSATSSALTSIDLAASSISSTLDVLSSQFASFGGLFSILVSWRLPACIGLIFWFFSRRLALYALLAIAIAALLQSAWHSAETDIVLVHYSSALEVRLVHLLRFGGVFCLLGGLLSATVSARGRALREHVSTEILGPKNRQWQPADGYPF